MKNKIFGALLIWFIALPAIGQDNNRDKAGKLLDSFQKNLTEGLNLVPFDTISNPSVKKSKTDAFINLCKSKGMIARSKAISVIDSKEKVAKKSLSEDEIAVVIYDAYKTEIPELKESYLDYIKSKSNAK
jgi:hypothetical protein